MKKLLSVLLAVLMVFALVGCSSEGGSEGGDTATNAPAGEQSKMEEAKAAGKITIANVVNGTLGDKSFFDSGEEAMQWINRDYGEL